MLDNWTFCSGIYKEPDDLLHKVHVRLSPSNLPRDKGAFIARTNSERMLSIEDVCAALKNRGGFKDNYHTLVHCVREFFEEMAYQLGDGYAINTGLFSIHPRVGGLFKNMHESPAGRPVKFSFLPREPMQRLGRAISISMEDPALNRAMIDKFVDLESDKKDAGLKPGGLFMLYGYKIKIKGDNPKCGVYFVSTHNNNQRFKVKRSYSTNTSSKVGSIVPSLPPGEYSIEIMTQYTIGGKNLKAPRIIESGFTIICPP
jgi:hypothetical protein